MASEIDTEIDTGTSSKKRKQYPRDELGAAVALSYKIGVRAAQRVFPRVPLSTISNHRTEGNTNHITYCPTPVEQDKGGFEGVFTDDEEAGLVSTITKYWQARCSLSEVQFFTKVCDACLQVIIVYGLNWKQSGLTSCKLGRS